MRNAGAAWPVAPALGRDAFLGDIRGLWGAEHSLLAALHAWTTPPAPVERPGEAVVDLVTHTGARLARLERVCRMLREAPSGRQSGDMWRIFERYAPPRAAGSPAGPTALQLHTALHEALGYLRVAYALAAARARAARMAEAARLLCAAHDDACTTSAIMAARAGLPGAGSPAPAPTTIESTSRGAGRSRRRAAAPSAGPRPTRRIAPR